MSTKTNRVPFFISFSVSFLLILFMSSEAAAGTHQDYLRWASPGSIGEWAAGVGEEFEVGYESSRRVLATSGYISYEALRRDSVPCSRRGASYYNCRPGAQANPYSRGCSAITQCRS